MFFGCIFFACIFFACIFLGCIFLGPMRSTRAKCLTHLAPSSQFVLYCKPLCILQGCAREPWKAAIFPELLCHLADFLPSPTLSILISFLSHLALSILPPSSKRIFLGSTIGQKFSVTPLVDILVEVHKQLLTYPFIRSDSLLTHSCAISKVSRKDGQRGKSNKSPDSHPVSPFLEV